MGLLIYCDSAIHSRLSLRESSASFAERKATMNMPTRIGVAFTCQSLTLPAGISRD